MYNLSYQMQFVPEALRGVDLVHGVADLSIGLNVSDQGLDDLIAEAGHGLGQLCLHMAGDLQALNSSTNAGNAVLLSRFLTFLNNIS